MSNPIVKCTVDQCSHYMPGDQCMAAKISIYNEEATGKSEQVKDTQCKSFHDRKTMGDMIGALHNANIEYSDFGLIFIVETSNYFIFL